MGNAGNRGHAANGSLSKNHEDYGGAGGQNGEGWGSTAADVSGRDDWDSTPGEKPAPVPSPAR